MVDMNGLATSAGFSYGIDFLAGRLGVAERDGSQAILSGTAGDRYLLVPGGTTAQRAIIRPAGAVRLNTTTDRYEFWTGRNGHTFWTAGRFMVRSGTYWPLGPAPPQL